MSKHQDDTYAVLRHGYPDFSDDHYHGRQQFLIDLPEQFLVKYGYIRLHEDETWEALFKCVSVTEEEIFKELLEFYRDYFSS